MSSTAPADEDAADMIHITSNGTGILLKRDKAAVATSPPATAREILWLAAICLVFGFAIYIGLILRTGGVN
ncbi:hypothetical protein GCM10011321_31870 [Youhaiella tibetensis]|uniref:Uncharacterized protein n=1 Tax=Paradevosia tibetensis TaxID=1447062 RepID=A0A5B9DI95_9HYPH|nr:hypothetical protein [Youhaiella tibetensis]QEE18854.1 hypothetical protein FNA67_01075 [Youhaiella tibetensis]GGF38544.1 hypothetical protein GCM10011321_31870 [Youhaiella tibetensis]